MAWRNRWENITSQGTDSTHFTDIFKHIFFNENVWISINISLKFVPTGPINNIPALVQIMAWRHPGDKPFSLLTYLCITRHMSVTWDQSIYDLLDKIAANYIGSKLFLQNYLEIYMNFLFHFYQFSYLHIHSYTGTWWPDCVLVTHSSCRLSQSSLPRPGTQLLCGSNWMSRRCPWSRCRWRPSYHIKDFLFKCTMH